jgi:hypothetical protein
MCGPFALAMGGHNERFYYLIGRWVGFTFASGVAAWGGEILSNTPIAPIFPFLMGGMILLFFFSRRIKSFLPQFPLLEKVTTNLLLKGGKGPLFLFGFFTLFLPCGQSLLLYGTSALNGTLSFGLWNGALFALFTTPSLLFAMVLRPYLRTLSKGGDRFLRLFALFTGCLAIARGGAELGWYPHVTYLHLSLW